jgi:hypothetical protein
MVTTMGIRHAVKNLSAPSVVAGLVLGLVLGLACAGGGAIAAGQITGAQIKDRTITHRDIASDTLKSRNVENESLRGKDIKNGSLSNHDIDVLHAVLTDEGGVADAGHVGARGDVNVEVDGVAPGALAREAQTGDPAALADHDTLGAAEGQAGTGLLSGTADTVRVNTTTSDGTTANKPFHLTVVC